MNKCYVIQWKSKINGRAGRGTKIFEFEGAARLAEELNREYPGIHHEAVEINSQAEPVVPEPRTQTFESEEAAAETSQVVHSPDFAFST